MNIHDRKSLWQWLSPDEQRPWPALPLIKKVLQSLGVPTTSVHLKPVGGRTAELTVTAARYECKLCLARQRLTDPRVVCPIQEEYAILRQVYARVPHLVPQPIGMIEDGVDEKLLMLAWVQGSALGLRINRGDAGRKIPLILTGALAEFHAAGGRCDFSSLTRKIDVSQKLQSLTSSAFRGLVSFRVWERTLYKAQAALAGLAAPTLLHGDAHAYNLMETAAGPCWLDFERLAVGPPEIDKAHAWVLLQVQTLQALDPSFHSLPQLACDFIVASGFLAEPQKTFSQKATDIITASLLKLVKKLQ